MMSTLIPHHRCKRIALLISAVVLAADDDDDDDGNDNDDDGYGLCLIYLVARFILDLSPR